MSYLDYAGLSHYKDKSLALYASKFSNPNLLINSNFEINQRGGESYQNNSSSTIYTVDRWRITLGQNGINMCTVTPKSGGGVNVAFTVPSGSSYASGGTPFIQVIDNPQRLIGKTITFSIYIDSINSGSCRFRLSNYTAFATGNLAVGLNKVSFTVPSGTTQMFCGIITNTDTSFNIDIAWAKLEVGDVATTYSPPLIAEELLKCQRYYTKIDTSPSENKKQIRVVAKSTNDFSDNCVRLPVRMRAIPAIELFSYNDDGEGYLYSISNATNKECDTPSIYRTVESFIVTKKNGGLVVDEVLYGYYSADAEIY